jgi:hypothetical protein
VTGASAPVRSLGADRASASERADELRREVEPLRRQPQELKQEVQEIRTPLSRSSARPAPAARVLDVGGPSEASALTVRTKPTFVIGATRPDGSSLRVLETVMGSKRFAVFKERVGTLLGRARQHRRGGSGTVGRPRSLC